MMIQGAKKNICGQNAEIPHFEVKAVGSCIAFALLSIAYKERTL